MSIRSAGSARRVRIQRSAIAFARGHRAGVLTGQWTHARLWRRIHVVVLDEVGARGELGWSRAILGAASVRAKGGSADRAEPG